MIDREKVIDVLTACAKGNITCKQSGCPYWGEYDDCIGKMAQDALELLKEQESVIRCKDCKYYAVENYYTNFCGYEILTASNVPTCHRWGEDACMVNPNGYCYLADRR